MSTANNDTSEIKQAAENANPKEVQDSLNDDTKVGEPENLTEEESTPFIEDEARTDK